MNCEGDWQQLQPGYDPVELSEWIAAKAASDPTVDSVYLAPAAAGTETDGGGGGGGGHSYYRYTLIGSEEALRRQHFLTLRLFVHKHNLVF